MEGAGKGALAAEVEAPAEPLRLPACRPALGHDIPPWIVVRDVRRRLFLDLHVAHQGEVRSRLGVLQRLGVLRRKGLKFGWNVKGQVPLPASYADFLEEDGSLTCRRGCVSKLPLHLPEGPLTSTTFSEQLNTLCPKELRSLKAMTKGYCLTRDASCKQAAPLGCIAEVQVG
eukprot:78280-Pleurochrysis_carterae.AAC.1